MNLGRLSAAALMASGLVGVLQPDRVGTALSLPPTDGRGRAETRAGLGGTYAALGAWALASRHPVAHRAVGITWLGAAAARLASLRVDEPETDSVFWLSLGMEVGLGSLAVLSSWAVDAERSRSS